MTDQKSLSSRASAELLLLALVWGGVFLSVRNALNEVGVLSTVAHRALWAALVLWGLVFALRLPVPRTWPVWGAFLVMGLLNNIIPFTLLNWSQLHIESGLTAILLVWAVLGEALHPRALLGFAILAFGLLILDGRLFSYLRNRV